MPRTAAGGPAREPEPVTSAGLTLAVRRLGAGPRLLALHGGPGLDHHLLLPLATALAGRLEVWLVDLPGHGASGPAGAVSGLDDLVNPLGRWLAGLTPEPAVLLGHSMGAFLVRELLRWNRLHPGAAALVSPPSSVGRQPPGAGGPSRPPRPAASPETASHASEQEGLRRGARQELVAHIRRETRGTAPVELLRAAAEVAIASPWSYGTLVADLHRAYARPVRPFDPGCPVLVVVGERDRTTPVAQAERVAEEIRGARLVRLAEVGHFPYAPAPEVVAEPVVAFLEAASILPSW